MAGKQLNENMHFITFCLCAISLYALILMMVINLCAAYKNDLRTAHKVLLARMYHIKSDLRASHYRMWYMKYGSHVANEIWLTCNTQNLTHVQPVHGT